MSPRVRANLPVRTGFVLSKGRASALLGATEKRRPSTDAGRACCHDSWELDATWGNPQRWEREYRPPRRAVARGARQPISRRGPAKRTGALSKAVAEVQQGDCIPGAGQYSASPAGEKDCSAVSRRRKGVPASPDDRKPDSALKLCPRPRSRFLPCSRPESAAPRKGRG